MTCRSRIKEEFDDGDECLVTLKDKAVRAEEDEIEWYDMAFGKKRNIMRIKFRYLPAPSANEKAAKQTKFEFVVKFEYQMFPELEEEFNKSEWTSLTVPL